MMGWQVTTRTLRFLRWRHSLTLPAVLALLLATFFPAVGRAAAPEPGGTHQGLQVYRTARAVHHESVDEARRNHPVHMRAVVTFYDLLLDARRPALFVHDATGAIFVVPRSIKGDLTQGSVVDIDGVSDAGDFAPIVSHAALTVVGRSRKPIPSPLVSVGQLTNGEYDGQWVAVEGVVRAVLDFGPYIKLEVETGDGLINAIARREPGANYERLVDSKIRIQANCGPTYNRHLQLTGVHLFLPGRSFVTVEDPAVADPFSLPLHQIDHLLRYSPDLSFRHREHLRGAVTLDWPGRTICIEDGTQPVCMQTRQTDRVPLGAVIDAVGFPAAGEFAPTMSEAIYRRTGETRTVRAPLITASQALTGEPDSALVQIDGKLIGRDKGSDSTLMISAGKLLFPIVLPDRSDAAGGAQELADGSALRITGICSVIRNGTDRYGDGFSVPQSFRILLRSRSDLVVVKQPPWWSARHLLLVLAILFAGTLLLLIWAAVLRRRLTGQARLIQKQNIELLAFSFQDGLTGLANRRKFDETLALELGRAARARTPLSLLMLDIDHFKALNDACGHQHGDECLVRVAAALRSSGLRSADLIARYGGEEFAVILPMTDEEGARLAGERLRRAVLDLAIPHAASKGSDRVTISVGVATVTHGPATLPATLLAMADRALYHSKQNGRNCTSCAQTCVDQLSPA